MEQEMGEMAVEEKKEEQIVEEKSIADKTPDEILQKIINPEGEFEVTLEGKKKKIFWSRIGFSDRIYFRSYFKSKLKEAVNNGLMSVEGQYKGLTEDESDGKSTVFTLKPNSIVEGTLKVYFKKIDGKEALLTEGKDYTYAPDFKALFFSKAPGDEIIVEYDYYDQQIYDEMYQSAFSSVLILLSCRNIDNHTKKVFKCIDEVNKLTAEEISGLISVYTNPNEKEIKNL